MNHLSAAMFEYDKHTEKGKTGCDHRKEVHGPRNVQMVAEKGQPGGRLIRRSLLVDHVLADGVTARRVIAKQS